MHSRQRPPMNASEGAAMGGAGCRLPSCPVQRAPPAALQAPSVPLSGAPTASKHAQAAIQAARGAAARVRRCVRRSRAEGVF